jgi:homoserine O-succinyltransferase
MTIIVPDNFHVKSELEERRIVCIPKGRADKQDIRPLRIGILNIMPHAQNYEFSLLFALGRSIIQIEPVWIRFENHAYKTTNRIHLESQYVTFAESVREQRLDGLILTGAPVEHLPYEDITYWDELNTILEYAKEHVPSTLGICWGALALAKNIGIEKEMYDKKLFGVFELTNLNHHHEVTGEMDDVFWCPQSRHAFIPDVKMEDAEKRGDINLLAHSEETGYVIFESSDKKFLMHLGHMEYDAERLISEYERDLDSGRDDVQAPVNLDVNNPVNRWRSSGIEFFTQWIKYVYLETPFCQPPVEFVSSKNKSTKKTGI